ncbi:hypothetical protein TNCV_350031 [Trichonephila clavipes]|nr:hypothetical protein TNCV_350031 [Trichonephila clavipes]
MSESRHQVQKTSPHKYFENPFLLSHQMPPGDTQTSKQMKRAGKEGTGTWRKIPFTILELISLKYPLLNIAKADWTEQRDGIMLAIIFRKQIYSEINTNC